MPDNGGFPASSPNRDRMIYPWNWGEEARSIQLSPTSSSCGSPDGAQTAEALRRGRPRADSITSLILEGSTSPSAIKCQVCHRVFPREKSLQAHLRTHTGERPYRCDYPGCDRAFAQSGQLRTHIRIHTGEKPFVCSAPGCESKFTHANRHCPDHPFANLRRLPQPSASQAHSQTNNENNAVAQWLEKYNKERNEQPEQPKTPGRRVKRQLNPHSSSSDTTVPPNKRTSLSKHNILDISRSVPHSLPLIDASVTTFPLKQHHPPSEQQDKWLGALALIQLAQTSENQPLNLSFHN